MDKIFLNDIRVDTLIGVYNWERQTQQTLKFDLEIDYDIKAAASSDDISDTLDYGAITQSLVQFVKASEYQLIETLAERLAAKLIKQFSIPKLTLSLTKTVVLHGQNQARVVIERYQQ